MRSIPAALTLLAALVLAGCATPAPSATTSATPTEVAVTPSPTSSPTPTPSPSPSPSPSASAVTETPAAAEPTDVAAELRAMLPDDLAAQVTSAELEGGSFLRIATTLVDPRGGDGSPAALQAISICESARSIVGVEDINLSEADGTSWVLFGHPMVPEGQCGEV